MSLIKEYFTQEETEAKNYVCNLCQKTFVAPATGMTSHLWTHLYRKHRKAYGRLKQEDADKKSKKGKRPTATSSEADDNKRQCLMSVFMPKRCTLQFVRRCYDLHGIYGRFDSKIRFEIESDGRFEIRFERKKTILRSLMPIIVKLNRGDCTSLLSVLSHP